MEWNNVISVLEKYSELLVQKYKDKVPRASGKLADSVRYEMVIDDSTIIIGLWLQDYWKWIEDGRPKTSNDGNGEVLRKIKDWISVKHIVPRPMTSLKTGKTYIPTEKQLAYLITRKIHNVGYSGSKPLERSMDEIRDDLTNALYEAIEKDVTDNIREIMFELKH